MYQAYLLLKNDTDFTLAKARERLSESFPEATFTEGDGSLELATDDWEIAFRESAGPDILEESKRIAEQVTGNEDDQGIGTCGRRLEMESQVPDFEMEHFDKFQSVLDTMRTFHGAILVDPREPCVL